MPPAKVRAYRLSLVALARADPGPGRRSASARGDWAAADARLLLRCDGRAARRVLAADRAGSTDGAATRDFSFGGG
eukprot:5816886-Pleurochrysis_carterae.AAC.1